MADQKMLNQEIYFSLRFFLAFSGSKPTKAAGLASLRAANLASSLSRSSSSHLHFGFAHT